MNRIIATACLLLLFSAGAHAAVLFDNGATIDPTNTTWNHTAPFNSVFDEFQLATDATITQLDYSLFAVSAASYLNTNITILDATGVTQIVPPITTVGALTPNGLTTTNTLAPNGFDVLITGLNIDLAAGTYVLNLSADVATGVGTGLLTVGSGNSGFGNTMVVNSFTTPNHLVFTLSGDATGTVPLPATLALLVVGLGGLLIRSKGR